MAWLTGSVGVLSEGIHSLLDLVSAGVAFFTIREAGKPADLEHPFGHGKFETLSSLFESLLLVVAAGLIIYEGFEHVSHPEAVRYPGLAIATIAVSLIVSYGVYRQNSRAALETDSSAIRVNALHFLSDVVASAGILLGLVILKFTGWLIVDSLMAFGVAAYILFISFGQVKVALLELTDTQLPDGEISTIRAILEDFHEYPSIEAHDLRTRKSGAQRHVDFHLVVCGKMSVEESHSVCDEIEAKIGSVFPHVSVNVHVEPCGVESNPCHDACPIFKSFQEKGSHPHAPKI